MIRFSTFFFTFLLLLSGCSSNSQKETTKSKFANVEINYYANQSVTSLEIPPDLTSPEMQNAFRLSEIIPNVKENYISFSDKPNKEIILEKKANINVRKNGNIRWVEIEKNPEEVWLLSKEFLKLQGFSIVKEDKKVGVIETDLLENRPDIPVQSLGIIRSIMGRALDQKYTFASVDKYRVRIEPSEDRKITSVYLTLTSLEEIIDPRITDPERIGATAWRTKEKDFSLETEMLYRLMVYLGGDKAQEKILEVKDEKIVNINVENALNGYAKLVLDTDLEGAWKKISWAIDQNNIELEDKDIKEKAFYIVTVRNSDKGIMSHLFGDEPLRKTFQLQLKEISGSKTELYFNDISEQNEPETKKFSHELLGQIAKSFK